MPRVRIDLPERYRFTTEIPVYVGHINAGNHVDNALMLTLVSEARARFFRALGYTEADTEGLGTTVADMAAVYRSEAFYGNVLVFQLAACDYNKYGFDLVWRAHDRDSGREIAYGKCGIVFLQANERRVAPVPPEFMRRAAVEA